MNVSVIIRTKGDSERAALLKRAVNSILAQQGVRAEVIIIFNGSRYDEELLRSLRTDSRIRCVVLDGPNLPEATRMGRLSVSSEYFSFLDDDDEYLPGALALRASYLNDHPQVDCVVTNGEYVAEGLQPRPLLRDVDRCSKDLVASILIGHNWLASCGGTFRTKTVTNEYFEGLPAGCEWTLLAFRIASELRVALTGDRTYRINATPRSESAGHETYMRAALGVMLEIEQRNRDPKRRRAIRRSLATLRHQLSSFYRLNGDFRQAWALHWRSVWSERWWAYFPYTFILATGSRERAFSLFRFFRRHAP